MANNQVAASEPVAGSPLWLSVARHQFLRSSDLGAVADTLSSKMFERRRITVLDEDSDKTFTYGQFNFGSSFILSGIDQPAHLTESLEPLKSVIIALTNNGVITDHFTEPDEEYHPGEALVMSPGQYAKLTRTTGIYGFGVVVLEEKLNSVLSQDYGVTVTKQIEFKRRLDLTRGMGKSLANFLFYICSEADDESSALCLGITREKVEHLLVTTILECIPHSYSVDMQEINNQFRPAHVKRAVDYIMDNLQRPINLGQLADITGVSARSLQLGFNETYGISPMRFVRDVRLKRARDELLKSRAEGITVAEVAERWQFQHHSQFSRLYQKRFGELPSKTLSY